MTAWPSLLIPAGAAASGGIITGVFAVWSQVITHRRTDARERDSRREAFMIRSFETERENLRTLHDALHACHFALLRHQNNPVSNGEASGDDIFQMYSDMMRFSLRAQSSKVRSRYTHMGRFST